VLTSSVLPRLLLLIVHDLLVHTSSLTFACTGNNDNIEARQKNPSPDNLATSGHNRMFLAGSRNTMQTLRAQFQFINFELTSLFKFAAILWSLEDFMKPKGITPNQEARTWLG
jgi:hypothetical protein